MSRRLVFGSIGVLAAVLASVSLAWACVPQGTLDLSPTSGTAGSTVTAKGSGFPAGDTVEVRWESRTGPVLATSTGPSFSVPITIPASATPGVHYISAAVTGEHRDHSATVASFNVTVPGAPPAPVGTNPAGGKTLTGTIGDDRLVGTPFDDVIYCGAGNDRVLGGGGKDVISCGSGNDRVDGGPGNDTILGGPGKDRLKGGAHNDRVVGGSRNDRLWGGSGNDRLSGGLGNDVLRGDSGRDRLSGNSGRDVLFGSRTDLFIGGSGRDRVVGRKAPSNDGHGHDHEH